MPRRSYAMVPYRRSAPYARRTRRRIGRPPAGEPAVAEAGDERPAPLAIRRALRMPIATLTFRSIFTLNSDGSGRAFGATSAVDPSHFSAPDLAGASSGWTAASSLWDLFKPYYAQLEYHPVRPNDDSAALNTAPISVCFDPDSISTPTSEDSVVQYATSRTFDLFRPFKYGVYIPRRSGAAVGGWLDMAAPTSSQAGIQFAADGLSAGVSYGRMIITLVTKFKATR